MGAAGRQRWAAAALAAIVGLTLAGCGSSDGSASDSSGSDGTATAATDPAAPSSSSATTEATEATDDGQAAALAAYVQAGQDKIPDLIDMFKPTYSAIKIEGEDPGTVVYTYVYSQQVDPQAAAKSLKSQSKTLQSTCDTALFPDMAKAGITTDPKVRYVYHNADDTEITSYTCTPS